MNEEILEAGPVQRGLKKEELAKVLSVGWHKFVAERKPDGSVGPLVMSTRDFNKSPMYPQHSEIAKVVKLSPENCVGGVAKFQEDGSFKFDDFLTPTTVSSTRPQQFEEALRVPSPKNQTTPRVR
ncbi:MAG: hypothetical protein FJ044_05975 [Candidatus Cloacimonetes bacterium]|nr:hypothetical protein [Candidatus Cloacimonadota bacterium]